MLLVVVLMFIYAIPAVASAPLVLGGYECMLGPVVAEGMYWTPVMLLNSPYLGNASAAQGVYTVTYTFGSGFVVLTSRVSTALSRSIYVYNGEAVGLFRLDEWAIYSTKNVPVIAGGYPCTQPYVARDLGSNPPTFRIIRILPSGTTSDADEPGQVYYGGYYSIRFNNGYSTPIMEFGTCGSPVTFTVSALLFTGVVVSINGYSSSGFAEIRGSTVNVWVYNLPQGYVWYISYAGDQGPAFAFEYVGLCQNDTVVMLGDS